jgi:hypothetical protein
MTKKSDSEGHSPVENPTQSAIYIHTRIPGVGLGYQYTQVQIIVPTRKTLFTDSDLYNDRESKLSTYIRLRTDCLLGIVGLKLMIHCFEQHSSPSWHTALLGAHGYLRVSNRAALCTTVTTLRIERNVRKKIILCVCVC